ncbi:MAG: hypothetical protein COB14_02930 [Alphaproteobacteria bacterium]|nr:MAG: hypothetical protein COB14_02930 [Alphaproteobacteria bacterium]
METLPQNQPETIEELNLQAYNRETVADQCEKFIMNIPLEPNKLAEVSYYMENMTPEIVHYQRALGEEGFGQEQKQEITEGIPRSHDSIVVSFNNENCYSLT